MGCKKRVICITGDGGLMMCLEELGTVRKHNLPIKIFVFNNQCHAIQKQTMDTWFNSKYNASNTATGLFFPKYDKIAEAFDIPYVCLNKNEGLSDHIQEMIQSPGPVFCNIEISEHQKIVPMLKFGSGLEELDPRIPVEELKKIMATKSCQQTSETLNSSN